MIRTYHYRCLPSRKQARLLDRFLEMARELYNAALQERRDAWKRCRRSIGYFDQQKQMTPILQDDPRWRSVTVNIIGDGFSRRQGGRWAALPTNTFR